MTNQAIKNTFTTVARVVRRSSFTSPVRTTTLSRTSTPGIRQPDSGHGSAVTAPGSRAASAADLSVISPASERPDIGLSELGYRVRNSLSRGALFLPDSAHDDANADSAPLASPLEVESEAAPPQISGAAVSIREDVKTPDNPTRSEEGGASPIRKPKPQRTPPRGVKSATVEGAAPIQSPTSNSTGRDLFSTPFARLDTAATVVVLSASPVEYPVSTESPGVHFVRSLRSDSKISSPDLVLQVMTLIEARCFTIQRTDPRYDMFVEMLTTLNLLLIVECGLGTYSPSETGIPRCVDPSHVDWDSLDASRRLTPTERRAVQFVEQLMNENNSFYVPLADPEAKLVDLYGTLFFERAPWIRRSEYKPGTVATHKQESGSSPFYGASRVQSQDGIVGNPTLRQTVLVPGMPPVVPSEMVGHSVLDRLTRIESEELLPGQYSALDVKRLWVLGHGFERPAEMSSRETPQWLANIFSRMNQISRDYMSKLGKQSKELTSDERDELKTLRIGIIADFIMKNPLLRGQI